MNVLPLGEDERLTAAAIIFECFRAEYEYLCPDKSKVIRAIASTLTNRFYAAYIGGEMAGVIGYSTFEGRATRFNLKSFREEIGTYKALLALIDFRSDTSLLKHKEVKQGEAVLLEFIATAPHFRGQGVATALITHLIRNQSKRVRGKDVRFFLEVFEKNPAANLYKRLGFKTIKRRRMLRSVQGNTHKLTMQYYPDSPFQS